MVKLLVEQQMTNYEFKRKLKVIHNCFELLTIDP